MRPVIALFSALCLLAGCRTPGNGPMEAPLDRLMQDYTGHAPGAAVLVVRDGVPVVRRGYGLADLEAATPVTPQTSFRLASVSKQFTAAAVLLLAQDGRLTLDDPVRRWLPALPPAAQPVTLRHLLTHASGVLDYEDFVADDDPQVHDADVLRLLQAHDRLAFAPGSDYHYSNSGYALLALVVEHASGQRYPEFLRQRIFAPLGMASVAHVEGRTTVPRRAFGHSLVQESGRWQRTDQSSTSAVLGDGGIYASIDDLAKWDAALFDARLLSDASRADAFTAHTPIRDETGVDGYGYGWRVHGSGDDLLLWHSGETMGFRNVILRWPRQRLTVVVLTNRNDPEPYPLAQKIAALYR